MNIDSLRPLKVTLQTQESFDASLARALIVPSYAQPPCVYAYQGGDTMLFDVADQGDVPEHALGSFPADAATLTRAAVATPPPQAFRSDLGAGRDPFAVAQYEKILEALRRVTAADNIYTPAGQGRALVCARDWVKHLRSSRYGHKEANAEKGRSFRAAGVASCHVAAGTVTVENVHGGKHWTFSFLDLMAQKKSEVTDARLVPGTAEGARRYAKERVRERLASGGGLGEVNDRHPKHQSAYQANDQISEGRVFIENHRRVEKVNGWEFSFQELQEELMAEGEGLALALESNCRKRQSQARGPYEARRYEVGDASGSEPVEAHDPQEAVLLFIGGYNAAKLQEGHRWPIQVFDDQKTLAATYEASVNERGDLLTHRHEGAVEALTEAQPGRAAGRGRGR